MEMANAAIYIRYTFFKLSAGIHLAELTVSTTELLFGSRLTYDFSVDESSVTLTVCINKLFLLCRVDTLKIF